MIPRPPRRARQRSSASRGARCTVAWPGCAARRVALSAVLVAAACSREQRTDPALTEPSPATTAGWSTPREIVGLQAVLVSQENRVSDLAVDQAGRLHAVFIDSTDRGRGHRVVYARSDGTWGAFAVLDSTPGHSDLATIVTDRRGHATVLWFKARDPRARGPQVTDLVSRTLDGSTWRPTESVFRHDQPITGYGVAFIDRPDGVTAGVATIEGSEWRSLERSGDRWDVGAPIAGNGHQFAWASQNRGEEQRALAYIGTFWTPAHPANTSDVGLRVLRGRVFDLPNVVHRDLVHFSYHPRLALDSRGTYHVLWHETGPVGGMLPRRILYATSADGRQWSPARDVTPDLTRGEGVYSPRLHIDARDRLHYTFTYFASGGASNPVPVYMRLENGAWLPAERVFPEFAAIDSELETAMDAQGRLWAVFGDGRGRYYSSVLDTRAIR